MYNRFHIGCRMAATFELNIRNNLLIILTRFRSNETAVSRKIDIQIISSRHIEA